MKKIIFIFGLITFLFLIVGCEEVQLYDNIGIEVVEYAEVPPEIKESEESRDYRFVTLKISGTPSDHFYGVDAFGLVEIYDNDGKLCPSYGGPLQGLNDDVLIKGTVYLSFLTWCRDKEAKSSTFIFYNVPTGPAQDLGESFGVDLSTVAAKKEISISKSISEEGLALLKKYAERQEAYKQKEPLSISISDTMPTSPTK